MGQNRGRGRLWPGACHGARRATQGGLGPAATAASGGPRRAQPRPRQGPRARGSGQRISPRRRRRREATRRRRHSGDAAAAALAVPGGGGAKRRRREAVQTSVELGGLSAHASMARGGARDPRGVRRRRSTPAGGGKAWNERGNQVNVRECGGPEHQWLT